MFSQQIDLRRSDWPQREEARLADFPEHSSYLDRRPPIPRRSGMTRRRRRRRPPCLQCNKKGKWRAIPGLSTLLVGGVFPYVGVMSGKTTPLFLSWNKLSKATLVLHFISERLSESRLMFGFSCPCELSRNLNSVKCYLSEIYT